MSKTIKLEDQVHRQLEELRGKKETFSQTVARLAAFYRQVSKLVWALGGDHPIVPGQGG